MELESFGHIKEFQMSSEFACQFLILAKMHSSPSAKSVAHPEILASSSKTLVQVGPTEIDHSDSYILYYIILYCIVLYYIILYYIILYYIILYYIILYICIICIYSIYILYVYSR